ncbi:MAG: peptide deformylase [Clostridiales bacterium]|nr:peptide deformylase [Clostridiales bacterium]
MAKRKILTDRDPTLRQISRPVERITPRIQQLLDDMLETMRAADGVGLAAPQVGVLRRLVVVEVEEGKPIFLINPEITYTSGEQEGTEGCLSVPGRAGVVLRPQKVTVKATGRDGKPLEITGTDLLARAFCHEIDHLDGKLYTDIALYMEDK